MEWLERKYIMLISSKLPKFKVKTKNVFNFKCIYCGDSEKKSSKTRGYLFAKKGSYYYFCHNCNASHRFGTFLKKLDSARYYEFLKEKLSEKSSLPEKTDVERFADKMKKPMFVKATVLKNLPKISSLDYNHPAKKYIDSRKIPSKQQFKLYYAEKFNELVNSIIPDKISPDAKEEPRIIIPFLDDKKILVGFQGRSLDPDSKLRYISIMILEGASKVWGLDSVDKDSTVYLTEGPFDAMFLPNAIAAAGGNLTSTINLTGIPKRNIVVVYDNEPRNKHIIKQNRTAIEQGFKVVIWPENLEYKDINQMVLENYSIEYIMKMIRENTFSGMEALLILNKRKKCDIEERKNYERTASAYHQ
jgi:hypothetical protein